MKTPSSPNIGVLHGKWGEDVAAEWLRSRGYVLIDRNVRPSRRDARLELDIIAYDRARDIIVFVEVKQHAERGDDDRLLRSVGRRKRGLLLAACKAWLRRNGWDGPHRLDVIEVYGTPESGRRAEIDHIERVRLFTPASKFVNWND